MNLVGLTEIAVLLGVSRQRINQLAGVPGFPKPVGEIAAGRIWERAAIERWALEARFAEPGYASAQSSLTVGRSDAEPLRLYRYRQIGSGELFVLVMEFRICENEDLLGWVRTGSDEIPGGFMVSAARWAEHMSGGTE